MSVLPFRPVYDASLTTVIIQFRSYSMNLPLLLLSPSIEMKGWNNWCAGFQGQTPGYRWVRNSRHL